MSEITDVINLYLKEKPEIAKLITVIVFTIAIGLALFLTNAVSVDQSMVSAPCNLIMDNSIPIPDGVVTKGYDIIRGNETMEYANGQTVTNPTISYECYYIKDAGLIERIIYQWDLYKI